MTAITDPDSNANSARSLGFSMVFAPCDNLANQREDATDDPLALRSPHGRPLKFQPNPGARILSLVPFEELTIGKRVRSLNTDARGTISEQSVNRGDATVSIDWDHGKKSPGVWHFSLDTVEEDLAT